MTELVDVIKIEVTLHHCNDGLKIKPLREYLDKNFYMLTAPAMVPCTEGRKFYCDDKIEMRWENTGLHEIPEEGGGDN